MNIFEQVPIFWDKNELQKKHWLDVLLGLLSLGAITAHHDASLQKKSSRYVPRHWSNLLRRNASGIGCERWRSALFYRSICSGNHVCQRLLLAMLLSKNERSWQNPQSTSLIVMFNRKSLVKVIHLSPGYVVVSLGFGVFIRFLTSFLGDSMFDSPCFDRPKHPRRAGSPIRNPEGAATATSPNTFTLKFDVWGL